MAELKKTKALLDWMFPGSPENGWPKFSETSEAELFFNESFCAVIENFLPVNASNYQSLAEALSLLRRELPEIQAKLVFESVFVYFGSQEIQEDKRLNVYEAK